MEEVLHGETEVEEEYFEEGYDEWEEEPYEEETQEVQPTHSAHSAKRGKGRKHRKRRRHYSSSSSGSSSSEDEPRKRRRSSGTSMMEEIKQMISDQIKMALSGDTQPEETTVQDTAGPSRTNRPDDRPTDQGVADQQDQEDLSEEDELLRGTSIPQEAFEKAVEVVREILGFEPPPTPPPKPGRVSRLSLNTTPKPPPIVLPVDIECMDRFQNIASRRKWVPTQGIKRAFRVDEESYQEIFAVPEIPETAKDKLKESGDLSSVGEFTDFSSKRLNKVVTDMDKASREGLRFASALMLFAEILTKSFEYADSRAISRKDTGAIVTMLGPTSRRLFDQFARISVRATTERRALVLDSMRLTSKEVKARFAELPMSGVDLFGGKFDSHLQEEADKKEASRKTELFMGSRRSQSRGNRTRGRSSTRRPAQSSGTNAPNRGRGNFFQPPARRPFRARGGFQRGNRRGSYRGRRGNSQP